MAKVESRQVVTHSLQEKTHIIVAHNAFAAYYF